MWIAAVTLALVYVFCLRGSRNRPGMAELRRWSYAHRGLHDGEKPENSMAAFRAALEGGFGIELDVHLLADGNLAVLHDSDTERVTGQKRILEELTTEELGNYRLGGTDQTIPEFREVLELFAGRAPMIVELKTHGGNADRLTRAACEMLESYPGPWCMESFDPRCLVWLRKNRPEILRGQLAQNHLRRDREYPLPVRLLRTCFLDNFRSRPDFIACRFEDRRTLSVFLSRRLWGISGVSWTIRNPEDYETARKEGWIPIFEGFLPGNDA